jgi:hypothetical protein
MAAVANSRSYDAPTVSSALSAERTNLFKEDRPRRIDRFISFFGDGQDADEDVCGEQMLESLGDEQWSER